MLPCSHDDDVLIGSRSWLVCEQDMASIQTIQETYAMCRTCGQRTAITRQARPYELGAGPGGAGVGE